MIGKRRLTAVFLSAVFVLCTLVPAETIRTYEYDFYGLRLQIPERMEEYCFEVYVDLTTLMKDRGYVLWGNQTGETGERGVDTADLPEGDGENARLLAKQTGAVVLQTGETDLVTDGEQVLRVQGGSDMLCLVTGAGCMLSALTGAFLAANPEQPLQAAASAAETMSVCAEIAQRRLRTGEGNASFRTRLIDAMCNLTPETFRKWRQEA